MTKTLARPNSNGFILEQQMTSVYVKDGNGKYGQNSTRLKRSLEVTLILQPVSQCRKLYQDSYNASYHTEV